MSLNDPIRPIHDNGNFPDMKIHLRGFAKAVLSGTLVAAPFLLLTVPVALDALLHPAPYRSSGLVDNLVLAVFPIWLAFLVVLGASVLVEIPTALVLRKFKAETLISYITIAAIAGFCIPFTYLYGTDSLTGSIWLCFLGVGSGVATAWTWSRSNQSP